jgi:hypothetical protein
MWDRPLSKTDVARWGDGPLPDGPIIGLATEDLNEKEAILASGAKGVFTIQHFDNYPAYLLQLNAVSKKALREAILDAWLAKAPERLAREYLATR